MKDYLKWTGRLCVFILVTIVPIMIACVLYDIGWHAIFGPEEPIGVAKDVAEGGGALLIIIVLGYPIYKVAFKLFDKWSKFDQQSGTDVEKVD